MPKYTSVALVILSAIAGLAAGLVLADWRFNDPDVLLAARVFLGGGGATIAGFVSKWLLLKRQPA